MPSWFDDDLAELRRQGLYRSRRRLQSSQSVRVRWRGRDFLNFSSNDYLNLAADPRLARAAARAAKAYGTGAGASPLVSGWLPPLRALERELARWEGSEACLVFASGFAANLAAVSALGQEAAIFSDALNHASLIDGCRLARAPVHVYRHADFNHLEELLRAQGAGARRRLIVSDTVFSMDGDLAPLPELLQLAERYDCQLLVDEAHATGVLGEQGTGLSELPDAAEPQSSPLSPCGRGVGGEGTDVTPCGAEWNPEGTGYTTDPSSPPPRGMPAPAGPEFVPFEPLSREGKGEESCARANLKHSVSNHGGPTPPARQERLIKVGTLSKALGSQGGFVCGSRSLIRYLVNKARPYIFSTALAPPAAAVARRALRIVRDEPERRRHLLRLAELLRQGLRKLGFPETGSRCQIVPVIAGEPRLAMRLAKHLEAEGLLVPAIRPPSVPPGTSRLRISLTAGHTEADVIRLLDVLARHAKPGQEPLLALEM